MAPRSYDYQGRFIPSNKGYKVCFEGFEDPRLLVNARESTSDKFHKKQGFITDNGRQYLPVTLGKSAETVLLDTIDLMQRFHLSMEALSQVAQGKCSLGDLLATRLTLSKTLTSFDQLFGAAIGQHFESLQNGDIGAYVAFTDTSEIGIEPTKLMGIVRQATDRLDQGKRSFPVGDAHYVKATHTREGLQLKVSKKQQHAQNSHPLVLETGTPLSIAPINASFSGRLLEDTHSWRSVDASGECIKKGKKGDYLEVSGFNTPRLYVQARPLSCQEQQADGSDYCVVLLNRNMLIEVNWTDFKNRFHLKGTTDLPKRLQQRRLLPQILDTYFNIRRRIRSAYKKALACNQHSKEKAQDLHGSASNPKTPLNFTSQEVLDVTRTVFLTLQKKNPPSASLKIGDRNYHVTFTADHNVNIALVNTHHPDGKVLHHMQGDNYQEFNLTNWTWIAPQDVEVEPKENDASGSASGSGADDSYLGALAPIR